MTGKACVVAMALVLAGCVNIKAGESKVMKTFTLDALPPAGQPVAEKRTVRLLPVRAAAGNDTDRMAYRRRPHELEYFARHAWVDAPARLLTPLLVSALDQGGVRAVTAGGATGIPLRVEAELVALYQDFTVTPSRSRLTLRVQMVDTQTGGAIAEKTFAADAASPTEDAYGGVQAANQALAAVLAEAVRFIGSVALTGPPAAAAK